MEPGDVCPEIRSFGRLMQQQLDRNAHKGHWTDGRLPHGEKLQRGDALGRANYFLALLRQKFDQIAIKAQWNRQDVEDLADLANYAMMVADLRHDLVQEFQVDAGPEYAVDLVAVPDEYTRLQQEFHQRVQGPKGGWQSPTRSAAPPWSMSEKADPAKRKVWEAGGPGRAGV